MKQLTFPISKHHCSCSGINNQKLMNIAARCLCVQRDKFPASQKHSVGSRGSTFCTSPYDPYFDTDDDIDTMLRGASGEARCSRVRRASSRIGARKGQEQSNVFPFQSAIRHFSNGSWAESSISEAAAASVHTDGTQMLEEQMAATTTIPTVLYLEMYHNLLNLPKQLGE